jgi:hypothetical protein
VKLFLKHPMHVLLCVYLLYKCYFAWIDQTFTRLYAAAGDWTLQRRERYLLQPGIESHFLGRPVHDRYSILARMWRQGVSSVLLRSISSCLSGYTAS